MNERAAQQALVAGAVSLVMTSDLDPSFPTYLSTVRDVLPASEGCNAKMQPVWFACEQLVNARVGDDRRNALCRLSYEVRRYFLTSMAERHAEFTAKPEAAA